MKIHKDCKIELAVSKEPHKESLHHPWFDGKRVIATDGRILAVVPVEAEDSPKDRPGYVPCGVLKEARMATRNGSHCRIIGLNGSIVFATRQGVCRIPRIKKLKFPDWEKIIPNMKGRKKHIVTLNPKLLWQLAQAVGGDEVLTLEFDKGDPHAVVKVTTGNSKAWGIIMPIKQNQQAR